MKKIAIILPFFGDGGMERAMMNLASGFLDKGIQVELVLLKKGYGTLIQQIPNGVKVINLGANNYFGAFFKFRGYLKNTNAEWFISLATPTNLICIINKLLAGKKIVLMVETQVTVAGDGASSLLKRIVRNFIYRLYNFSDLVQAASSGVAADLVNYGVMESKIKTIYNPVISENIIEASKQQPSNKWFSQTEVPVILGVGRLVAQKDFPTLLRAFAIARQERTMYLAILGEGPDRPELESLSHELGIDQDFALLGFSNNPYMYIKRASLFVLSSAWEGFGNVLAEAIGLGTPAVSTDCPHGPKEILENGKYGKLVAPGKPEELAKVILEILANPPAPEILRMGAERFTVQAVTQEYLKSFLEQHG